MTYFCLRYSTPLRSATILDEAITGMRKYDRTVEAAAAIVFGGVGMCATASS